MDFNTLYDEFLYVMIIINKELERLTTQIKEIKNVLEDKELKQQDTISKIKTIISYTLLDIYLQKS